MDAAYHDVPGALGRRRRGFDVERDHDAGQRAVLPERLGAELAGPARQTLPVVESRDRVQQAFGARAIRVELGANVGPDLEEDFVGFVRRGNALPGAGAQRRGALFARRVLAEREQQRRAARDPRIGAQQAAQLDAGHIGQFGVDDDDVGLGAPRALQRVPTRGLPQHGIPRRLEETP